MTDDAAWALAQHVCRPVGCMLGGSGSPGIDELFSVIARWGGSEEGRVLLRDTRLPAPQAALLNASMGHALDFDDTLDTGGSIHPGVSVLGSALAVCDSLGPISGRDVLLAVALGLDVVARGNPETTLDAKQPIAVQRRAFYVEQARRGSDHRSGRRAFWLRKFRQF